MAGLQHRTGDAQDVDRGADPLSCGGVGRVAQHVRVGAGSGSLGLGHDEQLQRAHQCQREREALDVALLPHQPYRRKGAVDDDGAGQESPGAGSSRGAEVNRAEQQDGDDVEARLPGGKSDHEPRDDGAQQPTPNHREVAAHPVVAGQPQGDDSVDRKAATETDLPDPMRGGERERQQADQDGGQDENDGEPSGTPRRSRRSDHGSPCPTLPRLRHSTETYLCKRGVGARLSLRTRASPLVGCSQAC